MPLLKSPGLQEIQCLTADTWEHHCEERSRAPQFSEQHQFLGAKILAAEIWLGLTWIAHFPSPHRVYLMTVTSFHLWKAHIGTGPHSQNFDIHPSSDLTTKRVIMSRLGADICWLYPKFICTIYSCISPKQRLFTEWQLQKGLYARTMKAARDINYSYWEH